MKSTLKILARLTPVTLLAIAPAVAFAQASSDLSAKDKEFVTKATQAGLAEVAAGQMAESKSSNAQVKQFGEQMVQDHSKAGDELKSIAQAKGITPPDATDPAHRKLAAKLDAASADKFDRLYVKQAGVNDHKAAVKLFTDEANHGKDPDLKAFAQKTLPTIQGHYRMAQDLAQNVGK
jgi:putative membrane protein